MSTTILTPIVSIHTNTVYISRAEQAIREGRPWEAISELLPRREDQRALKILAKAYCRCGQRGAALTTLSFLKVHDAQLEEEILAEGQ